MNFALRNIFVHTVKGFLTCCEILRHGSRRLYFASEGRCAAIFITLQNPSLRPCGKHTNHYTTEATLNLIKVLELCTVIDLWKVLQFCEVHFKTWQLCNFIFCFRFDWNYRWAIGTTYRVWNYMQRYITNMTTNFTWSTISCVNNYKHGGSLKL
jgi:hypothetical protein